jgi:hypothetical protein
MTETKDSATRNVFEVARDLAAPLFTQKGFIDVAARLNGAETIPQLREAFNFAEAICVLPPKIAAAWEDLRRALEECESPTGNADFAAACCLVAAANIVDEASGNPGVTQLPN